MNQSSVYIVVGLAIVLIAIRYIFAGKFSNRVTKKVNTYHYGRKDFLMSKSESDFLKILIETVSNNYCVFFQVHLSAILDEKKVKGQNWDAAFRHINGKSVDYVICDKFSIKPLLAVELDDWSHDAENRRERDLEVERILQEADLPIVRFDKRNGINRDEIRRQISEVLPNILQG